MGVFTGGHGWIRLEWHWEISLYVWNEMEVDCGAVCDRLTGSGGRLPHLCLGQSGVKLNRTQTQPRMTQYKMDRAYCMYNWCNVSRVWVQIQKNAVCDKISSGFSHTSSVTIIIHLCFGIRIANLKLFKHLGAFLSLDYVQVYTHILLYSV